MVPTVRSPSSGRRSWGTARARVRAPSRCDLVPVGDERPRLRVEAGSAEDLVEALVDEGEDGGHGAEVGGEGEHFPAARLDEALHLLVDRDVGAAEAVDRLLRVADDEELARRQAAAAPVGRGLRPGRSARRNSDLGLQRVGVLELVDEDESKRRWK